MTMAQLGIVAERLTAARQPTGSCFGSGCLCM